MMWRDVTYQPNDTSTLIQSLSGGAAIVEWIGFVPLFHDAKLTGLNIGPDSIVLNIEAFRITSETDARGYYILDKFALVTIQMKDVTWIDLQGTVPSILFYLRIVRTESDWDGSNAPSWGRGIGPRAGDYKISIEPTMGLEGAIYGREVSLSFKPLPALT